MSPKRPPKHWTREDLMFIRLRGLMPYCPAMDTFESEELEQAVRKLQEGSAIMDAADEFIFAEREEG